MYIVEYKRKDAKNPKMEYFHRASFDNPNDAKFFAFNVRAQVLSVYCADDHAELGKHQKMYDCIIDASKIIDNLLDKMEEMSNCVGVSTIL